MQPVNRKDRHVILAYMDESGEGGFPKNMWKRKHFARSCVLVRENESRDLENAIRGFSKSLPKDKETGQPISFHAVDVYHGNEEWKPYKEKEELRKHYMSELVGILEKHRPNAILAYVKKPDIAITYGENRWEPAVITFLQCGKMIEEWMKVNAADQRWAAIVGKSDYNSAVEDQFHKSRNIQCPLTKTPWRFASEVIGFISPQQSYIFPLSDLFAFAYGRHIQGKRDDWNLYGRIKKCIFKDWAFDTSKSDFYY